MNQCDGCRAGKPVDKNGNHRMNDDNSGYKNGYPDLMACTADRYEPEPEAFEVPMAPGPHPLRGPIFFFGGIVLALLAIVFLLSCATPGQTSQAALWRSIGDGLVFCLSHEPARSNPGFRDQCHVNAMFECLDHGLPRQCAEDTTLTSLPGGR